MKALIIALLALPLLALDNSVVVHEASGSSQTARPLTIYRSFAQGEFATGTYPKPRIGGTVPSVWQVDVSTTWPDGSVMAAYVSFRLDLTANGSATVDFVRDSNPCHLGNLSTCQTAALTQANMLDYDTGGGTGSWSATWYGTVNSIEYSASARTMLAAAAWRWMLRGPVVSAVIVEDRSSSFAYDFGWTYDTGTSAWIAPTSNTYKSLHPVFEIRFYPDPDGAGALTAWGGVEVDAILQNASLLRLQGFDSISLSVKTGNAEATTAYSVTSKLFHPRSRRHSRSWSGTAPGAIVVDYNFPYLIHTKLIGPYDYNLAVANTLADTTLSLYDSYVGSDDVQWCSHATYCGNWTKAVGTTGGRGDIALIPTWYLNYLYLMGHGSTTVAKRKEVWDKLVIGNADAAGSAPIHYMETDATKTFFSWYDSTSAVGRFVTINARMSYPLGATSEQTAWPAACAASPCDGRGMYGDWSVTSHLNGWKAAGVTNFTSHEPPFYAIPAFLTGYHYYITGAQMEAAFALATTPAGTGSYTDPGSWNGGVRYNPQGIIWYDEGLRATPWVMRDLAWAYILTPDSEVEKPYFADKLQRNARWTEGVMMLANGADPPDDPTCASYVRSDATSLNQVYDSWCAGRAWWIESTVGQLTSNPLYQVSYGSLKTSTSDGFADGARTTTGYWQSYMAAVWAWIASTGAILDVDDQPMFTHVRDAMAANLAGRVLSSPKSMYLLRDIQWGVGGSGAIATTFADVLSSYVTSYTLDADISSSATSMVLTTMDIRNTGDSWLNESYVEIDDEIVQLSGTHTINSPSAGKATVALYKRGVWGTTPAAHTASATVTWIPGFWATYVANTDGYPVVARGALALLADATKIGSYSPVTAYRVYSGALPNQDYKTRPMWAFTPRERVQDLAAVGGTGTASFSFLAPSGAACKVYVGSALPSTSSDTADASATNTYGKRQTYSASGLSAGTNYYRISCGTARASGTVTVN